ncbi:hypothetical protein BDV95DRAFT_375816 [Massariosphaeria phaeospora]|uniref:Uncharacterized protein n=1 Tax=Massariosphaeria phaeospora TaxID=100035 RepID=A0A7C8MEB3_9PLEO|nr:hypothetical protein BDV95DRAFT_375816 [Massariosphaeria phaeospora]
MERLQREHEDRIRREAEAKARDDLEEGQARTRRAREEHLQKPSMQKTRPAKNKTIAAVQGKAQPTRATNKKTRRTEVADSDTEDSNVELSDTLPSPKKHKRLVRGILPVQSSDEESEDDIEGLRRSSTRRSGRTSIPSGYYNVNRAFKNIIICVYVN